MNMTTIKKTAFILTSMLLAVSASAAQINVSTGQNAAGIIQTSGNMLDAFWTATGAISPKKAPNLYTVFSGNKDFPDWAWVANSSNSTWVAPNPNDSRANGRFTATTQFDMTGLNLQTAFLSGKWAMDDNGTLSLNGTTLSTMSNFGQLNAFSAASNLFVSGINTLTMTMNSADNFYEGARLEGMVTAVPEPGSIALLGLGLCAFSIFRRKTVQK